MWLARKMSFFPLVSAQIPPSSDTAGPTLSFRLCLAGLFLGPLLPAPSRFVSLLPPRAFCRPFFPRALLSRVHSVLPLWAGFGPVPVPLFPCCARARSAFFCSPSLFPPFLALPPWHFFFRRPPLLHLHFPVVALSFRAFPRLAVGCPRVALHLFFSHRLELFPSPFGLCRPCVCPSGLSFLRAPRRHFFSLAPRPRLPAPLLDAGSSPCILSLSAGPRAFRAPVLFRPRGGSSSLVGLPCLWCSSLGFLPSLHPPSCSSFSSRFPFVPRLPGAGPPLFVLVRVFFRYPSRSRRSPPRGQLVFSASPLPSIPCR